MTSKKEAGGEGEGCHFSEVNAEKNCVACKIKCRIFILCAVATSDHGSIASNSSRTARRSFVHPLAYSFVRLVGRQVGLPVGRSVGRSV